MLPNDPRAQHHKRIEALLELSRNPQNLSAPQLFKQTIMRLQRQLQQANWLQEACPNLPGEHTRGQQVIYSLALLIT
jgi:hypothetical protein